MLPRLIIVADGFTRADRFEDACRLVEVGLPCIVQLRDHEADGTDFHSAAAELKARTERAGSKTELSINGKLEVASALGTHVHAGRRGPDISEARRVLGPGAYIGYSAHTADDLKRPDLGLLDYVTFSPVFPPISKPERQGRGLDALAPFAEAASPLPVFALGGVSLKRVTECLGAGAFGVAVLSAVVQARDPVAAAAAFTETIENYLFE